MVLSDFWKPMGQRGSCHELYNFHIDNIHKKVQAGERRMKEKKRLRHEDGN